MYFYKMYKEKCICTEFKELFQLDYNITFRLSYWIVLIDTLVEPILHHFSCGYDHVKDLNEHNQVILVYLSS